MSYTSREPYAAQPTPLTARGPDPRAASLVSDTLAQNLAHVSQQFMQLWGATEQAKNVNAAAAITAKASMAIADMQKGFEADPDPSTVPQRFPEKAAELRAAMLEGVDPGVASHVARAFDQHLMPTAYRQTIISAHQRTIGNLRGQDNVSRGAQAQLIADARDEPQLLQHVQAVKQSIAGNVAAGVYNQGDAPLLLSHTLKTAITIRSASDPVGAQALLDRFKDQMDAGDVAALTTSLRAPVERRQGENAATAAIALSGGTTQRAQAVEAAFIARGWSPAAARGLAANAVQESGASPNPPLGDGGRSSGLFQWNDSRRAAFVSQYGVDPHQATLDQQVAFADWELKNTEAGAGAALAAAKTPEEAARIASTRFLRPRDTAAEEARRSGIATRLGGGTTAQRDTAMADVRARLSDAPLHVRLSAESQVAEHYAHLDAQNQQARALLHTDLKDLSATYLAGNTTAEIPEARIRALSPDATTAQRTIDELTLARTTGDAVRAVSYAAPADVAAMRARLAGNPADTRMAAERQQAVAAFDQATARAAQAATHDPAGYAATAPEVAALRAANAPLPQQIAANLAVQSRIGLPPHKQRILDNAQTEQIAATLRTTGPEKADMAATLSGVAQQFGPELWNRAFGELVQHGKIGWEWQAIAGMTAPAQAEGRAQIQQAMTFMAAHGGPEGLRKLIDPAKLKEIAPAVTSEMAKFGEATRLHPGGSSLFATMQQAVQTLTEWRMYRGQDAGAAAKAAYQDVIGARWDTAGDGGGKMFGNTPTLLVPKGRAGEVETAMDLVRGRLTARDVQALPDPMRPDAPEADLAKATLDAVHNGVWINNADASGAVLKGRTRGGGVVDVIGTDGRPIEISFAALPKVDSGPGILANATAAGSAILDAGSAVTTAVPNLLQRYWQGGAAERRRNAARVGPPPIPTEGDR